MKMKWKEYGQITEAGNSLRQYYGLETYHETDPDLDSWLQEKKPRCVIALLIDAMGISVMQKHLLENGFFFSHLKKEMTTVFPPTTSAATTSFRTGKSPMENAWLGWNQYFRELDDNLILFRSQSQYTNEIYPEFISRTIPFKDQVQDCMEHQIPADAVWPSWGVSHPSDTYACLLHHAADTCMQNRFVYVYWDAFDTFMHTNGPSCKDTGTMLRQIERETEAFAKGLPEDCALVIIADHSQIDIHQEDLEKEKELCACFQHKPALEPRTISFSIKEEKKTEFVERFHTLYGDAYHLYSHDEVMQGHFFGNGTIHPRTEEFIGDYVAVAESDLQLFYKKGSGKKGDHAGGCREEAMIPLILYTKK